MRTACEAAECPSARAIAANVKTSNTGFTLAEVALVLVVVGLLLGGIMEAQEMVTQPKIKHAIADINGVSAAMYATTTAIGRFPGTTRV